MRISAIHTADTSAPVLQLPFHISRISAGFPSPADDYVEERLDLNTLLVQAPSSTFFVRVQGHSMEGIGIFPDDILVVNRALTPRTNDIILAIVDGEFTVKRWVSTPNGWCLQSEHMDYPPIFIQEEMDFEVWGVVTFAIHTLQQCSP